MKCLAHALIATLLACMTLSCGGEDSTGPEDSTTPGEVALVVVKPNSATLISVGDTVRLTASAEDANGNTVSDKTFTWSSSDRDIATVSTTGLANAVECVGV